MYYSQYLSFTQTLTNFIGDFARDSNLFCHKYVDEHHEFTNIYTYPCSVTVSGLSQHYFACLFDSRQINSHSLCLVILFATPTFFHFTPSCSFNDTSIISYLRGFTVRCIMAVAHDLYLPFYQVYIGL